MENVARHRSFTLLEGVAAVHVAEKSNNYKALQRLSVLEKLIRERRKAEASGKWSGIFQDS